MNVSILERNTNGKKKVAHSLLGYVLAMPALLMTAQLSYALSDSEVEAMLHSYEERIQALESQLQNSGNQQSTTVSNTTSTAPAGSISTVVVKPRVDSSASSRLRVNGFITAQAQSSNEDLNSNGISETLNFRGNSKAGLQLNYQLNDKADATIQLVARSGSGGDNAWRTDAEWAYVGYKLTDDLKVRMGRLRLPFYMYSDSLEVGYTYPWVKPPMEVYRSPLSAFDGIDMLYDFRTGALKNRLQVWGGSFADTSGSDNLMLKNLYGSSVTSTLGDFSARLMYFTIGIGGTSTQSNLGSVTLPPGAGPCPPIPGVLNCTVNSGFDVTFKAVDTLDYSSFGLNWDNGQYFVITETTDLNVRNGLFFKDEKSGYISGGVRIKEWTPYATYAWYYTTNENSFATSLVGGASEQNKSTSLGLRRELGEGLSAKAQWDHYNDFNGSNSFFGFNTADNIKSADVWTLSLDAVF